MPDFRQFRATPNLLTMFRLFLLPFLVIEILDGHWRFAFALLWVAGLSDSLDGVLARKLGQHTTLGQYLDPIADKALLSTLFLVLTHVGVIPRYVTVLVFSRDLGILLISTLLFVTGILRDFRPSWLGKVSTAVQILAVLTVMTVQVVPGADLRELRMLLLRAVAVLAPLSAAQYAWTTLRKVQAQGSGSPHLGANLGADLGAEVSASGGSNPGPHGSGGGIAGSGASGGEAEVLGRSAGGLSQ